MHAQYLEDINIKSVELLATPRVLRSLLPQTPQTQETVKRGREAVKRILDGRDRRMLAIVGPCSIHNIQAAEAYAGKLARLAEELAETLLIIMRVYFEKPRSVLGWKGFVNDPYLDDSFRMEEGMTLARKFLITVARLGLPAATEVLDILTPQYLGDLIAWSAIGARTAESQTHREIASGISTPVGFKNPTGGSIEVAINGIKSAYGEHHFLGATYDGLPAVFSTSGNPYSHIVLRGGKRPNYDAESVAECEQALCDAGLPQRIVIDCSHGNSRKNHERQAVVLRDILTQIAFGNTSICGFMLESFLEAGAQALSGPSSALRPGMSITDACVDWDTTEVLLRQAHEQLLTVQR